MQLFIAAPFIGIYVPLAYKRAEEIKDLDPSSEAFVITHPTGQFAVVVGSMKDVETSKEIMRRKIASKDK